MAVMVRLLLVWMAALAAPDAPAPKPIWVTHGESTFIDDPLALSPSGDRLAYVRTRGAEGAQRGWCARPGEKTGSPFRFPHSTPPPGRRPFPADGKQLLVVTRTDEKREAQLYDLAGKAVGRKIGPAEQI